MLAGSYSKPIAADGAHFACSFAIPFFAMQRMWIACPLRSFTIQLPVPSESTMTGRPTSSFGLLLSITRSRAYTFMISLPVHFAFSVRTTEQLSQ